MFHRVAIGVLVAIGLAMTALSLVWPQGQGARSPPPFGHDLSAPERMITIGGRPIAPLRGARIPEGVIAPREP